MIIEEKYFVVLAMDAYLYKYCHHNIITISRT